MVLLWGSNARAAHPIFFHHLLKGLHNGARMYAIDPRRTDSAAWADVWLGLDVGADIALANAMGKVIIDEGLAHRRFIDHATTGFDDYAATVADYPLDRAEQLTGIPGEVIRETAIAYASADKAQICWTLGITEHHNATDNVLALINLALLTGHVGREGSGLVPLRGQNNVQGGGDMGALPNKLPGFQDVEDDQTREKFEQRWGAAIPPTKGWHLSEMFEAMDAGTLRGVYVIGENPADSEADVDHARKLLTGLDTLIVQDLFLTHTAQLADVVLPAAADWAESEGTVTNSERRVQRVRRALPPPGEARTDLDILVALAGQLGHDWSGLTAEAAWDELRGLSPMHAGMRYDRLEALGGIQWPCPHEDHPGTRTLHTRLWDDPLDSAPAPFIATDWVPPVDQLSEDYPYRLTTGRHLDGYNTGVQSGGYSSPNRSWGTLDVAPDDAAKLGLATGDLVRVRSRRGELELPARLTDDVRPGLTFMAVHYPEQADVNLLTIDTWDPKSGTAEFKATAVALERVGGNGHGDIEVAGADHAGDYEPSAGSAGAPTTIRT